MLVGCVGSLCRLAVLVPLAMNVIVWAAPLLPSKEFLS